MRATTTRPRERAAVPGREPSAALRAPVLAETVSAMERACARPLDGDVALVTGASGGIGGAIAVRLAALGARVVVHHHTGRAAAEAVLASLGGASAGHAALGADLRDPAAVERLVADAAAFHGRLDVLVNNAGLYELAPPLAVSYAEFRAHLGRMLETNFLSAAHASYCAAHVMRKAGGGRIVNVGSRGAFRGEPDAPGYGASKAALHQLTQSLAQALAPAGISVFAVAPGFVETAMARPHMTGERGAAVRAQSPFGRVASVDDVAYFVGALACREAAFASGAIIDVNGASYLRT